jgi:N-acetylneuraminic acid mutarotase
MPWTAEPSLTHPRAMLAAATCDAPAPGSGSRIYAIGGTDGNTDVATVEVYDTAQKTWSTTTSMPTPRHGLAAASSPGRLHALGGWQITAAPLTAHEVYEPANNAWSQAAPLPTARGALAAVTGPDGLIYAIGGFDGNNPVATVEAYDPATDKWITKAQLHTPRMYLAAVAGPDGLIYAIGGGGLSAPLNSVEVFNIAANTWTPSPHPLPAASCGLAAAVDPNGLIYALGGIPAPGKYTANVYSYDPTATGWATRPPLSSPRAVLATATGPDGLVYAIGGNSSSGVLADVEAYSFDRCDYIEFQIDLVGHKIDQELNLLALSELTPQQRTGALQQIAGLRAQQNNLLAQLKICRLTVVLGG